MRKKFKMLCAIEAGSHFEALQQLSVMKADKRAIFSAAAHAQRAADYLHNLQPKSEEMAA